MPPNFTDVEVVLEGLDQKTSRRTKTPGKLKEAINVEFSKSGDLNKRRGYERVDVSTDVTGAGSEAVFFTVATYRQELVLYGSEYMSSVVAIDPDVSSASVVRRGPTMAGSYRIHQVFASPIGEDA